MFRELLVLAAASVLISACTTRPVVVPNAPQSVSLAPVSISEAFQDAKKFTRGVSHSIPVVPGQAHLVTTGAVNSLVVPALIDDTKAHLLKVRSFVVQRNDGAYVLLYPVVSFIDSEFKIYRTLKPSFEFTFEGNMLTNEFKIPVGTKRLLVHTDDEFVNGTFTGTMLPSEPHPLAYGVAGVLGGALGTLALYGASRVESEKEFRFGAIGVVAIEID